MNIVLSSRDKAERLAARKRVISRYRQRTIGGKSDPFFELEWIRTLRDNPDLVTDIDHNRRILWQAHYEHLPYQVQRHFSDQWRNLSGHSSEKWVFEGWYDEVDEFEEDEREYDERREI